MSEVLENVPQETVQNVVFNAFDESLWSEKPPVYESVPNAEQPPVQHSAPPAANETVPPPVNEEIFDESQYLKDRFGYESPDALKKELEELRAAKSQGFQFANDDSRKVFEYIKENKEDDLYNYIDQKRRVERLVKADLSDKNAASELIKLNYKLENRDLSDAEVDFLFSRKFKTPSKPIQDTVNESDEEYQVKLDAWNEIVREKEMELSIEAKLAKPKIEKLKSELVLPDIQKPVQEPSNEMSQEELAKIEQARGRYLNQLEDTFKTFNGFDMVYKSEAGDVPISYLLNEQEKGTYKSELSDFELGKFMDDRWFQNGGDFNVRNLSEDLYLLKNRDKIFQKIASEAYAKGIANYLKTKSNITVNPTNNQPVITNNEQTEREKQIAFIWANS